MEKWIQQKFHLPPGSLILQLLWIIYPLLLGFLSIHFLIRMVNPVGWESRQIKKYFYILTWILFLFLIVFTFLKFTYTMWVMPGIAFVLVLVLEKWGATAAAKTEK